MAHAMVLAVFIIFLSTVLASPARGHGPNAPPHQLHLIGDFKLESGEVIKDFAISYVTHGALNAKKSNAIPGSTDGRSDGSRAASTPTTGSPRRGPTIDATWAPRPDSTATTTRR
jgi:hypothetical protein